MRRFLATTLFAVLGLVLPLWALGQTAAPVAAPAASGRHEPGKTVPVWAQTGRTLSLTAADSEAATVPWGSIPLLDGHARSSRAGVLLTTRPGFTAHAGVRAIRWLPLVPTCNRVLPSGFSGQACAGDSVSAMQHGELGAGFSGDRVKLDLSVGQTQTASGVGPVLSQPWALPRILPSQGGADVAAPLWFRNSTATDVSARGQINLAPDTRLDLGASVGRVHLLPGSSLGLATGNNTIDQTTLSFGIEHGNVRGVVVGHMLEPDWPDDTLDGDQRWTGIDLGVSVRLPGRGELSFGAQNVWTSGHAPLLFGGSGAAPVQGRVPYVQYHQDL